MPDGNAEQVRQITDALAEQAANMAVEKYVRENPNPDPRLLGRTKIEWGVIVSLCASAASLVFTAGFLWGQVQANTKEIDSLRQSNTDTVDRLARIETKLDIILTKGAVQ